MNNKKLKELAECSIKCHTDIISLIEDSVRDIDEGFEYQANNGLIEAERISEDAVLIDRKLPVCAELKYASEIVKNNINEAFLCEMGFSKEGWFCLRMPVLLPKKERSSFCYIRDSLLPQFEEYFENREIRKYDDCVIVFNHVYDPERPERQWRDHDNIETNIVTDIIAFFLMPDDGPLVCDHYNFSSKGLKDATHVYLIPKKEFANFLLLKDECHLPVEFGEYTSD